MNKEFLEFQPNNISPYILQPIEYEIPRPSKESNKILHCKDYNTLEGYKYIFNNFYRKSPTRIFEIGVYFGGSIPLWGNLFPNATVVGIDIRMEQIWPSAAEYIISKPNLHAVECDVMDSTKVVKTVNRLLGNKIDIIIDDGQHNLRTMMPAFKTLWPMLEQGGLYVIEDWLALARVHRNEILDQLHFMLESEWFKKGRKPHAPQFIGALRNTIVIQKV